MLYLLLSILGSVSVGVFLKIVKQKNISIIEMIVVNYIITTLCTYFFFQVDITQSISNLPLFTVGSLAILLPTIFLVQYFSIQSAGIIKTDIAQRISLLIPILAAITIFNENITILRYIGLFLGLLAVLFILNKPKSDAVQTTNKSYLLVLVFIGFGVIDVFFKQLALYSEIPYTSTLFYVFGFAFIISVCITIGMRLYQKQKLSFSAINVLYGVPLGVLNFINILFYMKAHKAFASNPTTVFAGMNFGVILLGTLIGYFYFKEKMSVKNWIGLCLAMVAVSLIVISQLG